MRPADPARRARVERSAAAAAVGVGVTLMVVKFVAYSLTGSAAILSDALESIVNVAASGVAFVALRYAHAPADESHPYGHGKAEFVSAAFEGGAILLAAVVVVARAAEQLLTGRIVLENLGPGMALVAGSALANGAAGLWLVALGRRNGSMTLEADGRHLASDALTSVVALAALLVVRATGWDEADPLAALAMAGYIAWTGWRLVRRALGGLMDEQDLAAESTIRGILEAHTGPAGREPRICSYHKVRHRHTGRYVWIDLHIRVGGGETVRRGHEIASRIEHEIETALGESDATAHVEPCEHPGCPTCSGAVTNP